MANEKDPRERSLGLGKYWAGEIQEASEHFDKWYERGKNVIRRYRDERDVTADKQKKFNILWSNVQVMKPALYGRMPKPEVTRRFKDQDPVARTAATMLERCLEYEIEQYPDFDATMTHVVEDRLLPGRGTAWVRYEPSIVQVSEDEDKEQLEYECAPCDYVHWQDFLHTPARTWEEVWWVARRVFMTREELRERFGKSLDKKSIESIPLQHEGPEYKDTEAPKEAIKRKAEVWEIWDKDEETVIWIAKGFDKELDVKPDPLQLEDFFPCPKPLFATTTSGTLIPVPDFTIYQDQADEVDTITNRISKITRALKVSGVYNAEYPALKRLLQEGTDNTLIPVDSWAAFAEKKGLEGAIQFIPLKEVIETLVRLYEAREAAKQVIYEVFGISDIIRGATEASETLGAQQLKAQFGSMRMRTHQQDVARFASDLLRKKSQIICRLFSPQTIMQMSGVQFTPDMQFAQPAMQLLKGSAPQKNFRIEVAADSFVQLDEAKDKQERLELIQAVGTFLKEAVPVMQLAPQLAPFLGEVFMFGLRAFKVGKHIEAVYERTMSQGQQQPQGVPMEEVEKAVDQARMEEKQNAERELGHIQKDADLQVREFKLQTTQKLLGLEQQNIEGEIERKEGQDQTQLEREKMLIEMQEKDKDRQATAGSQQSLEQVSEIANALNDSLKALVEVSGKPKRATRSADGEFIIQ